MAEMSNEQAAVEFFKERITAETPIAEGDNLPQGLVDMARHSIKLYTTALAALRDKLKRSEGCDFCNESEQIQNQYGDIMEMDEGVLILDTEGYPGVTFRIKYCPDCGRELSGNAEQVKEGEK